MAKENRLWANIRRFQILIWIIVVVVGVAGFFLTMGGDVSRNTEDIAENTITVSNCENEVDDVQKMQAVMQKEVENISEDVKEIKVEQRTMRKDMADRLDRIYEKVK